MVVVSKKAGVSTAAGVVSCEFDVESDGAPDTTGLLGTRVAVSEDCEGCDTCACVWSGFWD